MDGVINLYKEKGYTSHDAVAVVRRALGQKRVGHTGTLDPLAEGVLPICVGKATRLVDFIMGGVKGYRAHITFGAVTDTQDAGGAVLERRPVHVSRQEIISCVQSFAGGYDQVPPMYSAVKVGGQRLYKLARAGEVVERTPRRVEIFEIAVRAFVSDTEAVLDVVCGKGTYIRTLCADIGEKLGCGAYMSALVRTRAGDFYAEDAITLGKLQELAQTGRTDMCLIPPEKVLSAYAAARVRADAQRLLHNGNGLREGQWDGAAPADGERLLMYDLTGRLCALYRYHAPDEILKCEIMF